MAELVAEHLPQFCPQTNLYRLDSGQHILVTRIEGTEIPMPRVALPLYGMLQGIVEDTAPCPTEVFLCDETGRVIDADGDPANGMTALLRLAGGTDFDTAVQKAEEALNG